MGQRTASDIAAQLMAVRFVPASWHMTRSDVGVGNSLVQVDVATAVPTLTMGIAH
jgi:hypothetical protein